jgi:hypothetical protein
MLRYMKECLVRRHLSGVWLTLRREGLGSEAD